MVMAARLMREPRNANKMVTGETVTMGEMPHTQDAQNTRHWHILSQTRLAITRKASETKLTETYIGLLYYVVETGEMTSVDVDERTKEWTPRASVVQHQQAQPISRRSTEEDALSNK